MSVIKTLLSLIFLSVLVACAGPRTVVTSQSTLSEVRASLGRPTDIRFGADGDEFWEYAHGPQGTETYLIRASQDGRVKSITQLLTVEQFAKIMPGQMNKADVRQLLGRPSDESFLYNGTSWSWRVHLVPEQGYFIVHFDPNDVVLDKFILMDISDGDGGGEKGEGGGGK